MGETEGKQACSTGRVKIYVFTQSCTTKTPSLWLKGRRKAHIYIYPKHAVEYSLSRAACKERERHVSTDEHLNSCINGAVKTRSSISSLMNVAFFRQMGCARFRKCGSDLSIGRAQMASNKIKMIYYDRFACARLSKQTSVLDN